jgi:hypothetical protein
MEKLTKWLSKFFKPVEVPNYLAGPRKQTQKSSHAK